MSVLDVLPRPRPVKIGDKIYFVGELQIRDLAGIQLWLQERTPHPLELIRADLDGLEGEERLQALRAAWRESQDWPPRWDTPKGKELLGTAEGVSAILTLILSKHQELTSQEIGHIVATITPEEFSAVKRIAYALDPTDELVDLILGDEKDEDYSKPQKDDLAELVHGLAVTHGWTYEQIGEMTLSQFGAALRHGKPREMRGAVPPGVNVFEWAAKRRRLFYGD